MKTFRDRLRGGAIVQTKEGILLVAKNIKKIYPKDEKNKNEDLINNQDNKLNQDNYKKIKLRNEQSKELNDWYENEYGKKKLNSI